MAETETIPDDIMAIAVVVVDDAADECKRQKLLFGFPTAHGKEVLDEYIARALMAERLASEARGREKQKEADARIAENAASYDDELQRSAGCMTSGQRIASLIRK